MTETGSTSVIKMETTRFGQVEVDPTRVVTLPQGMVGFPLQTKYTFIQHRDDSPLHWLQSLERPDLAFVVVNPLIFDQGYQVAIGRAESKLLKVDDPAQIQVWVVVTIPQGHPEKMTANLRAPVVVNLATRLAAQVIMENSDLPLRKPLVGGQ